jgi:hypothetical protein
MSTTGSEPIVTSYAKAPARTITAGGVALDAVALAGEEGFEPSIS